MSALISTVASNRERRRVFERQVIPMRANLYGAAMRLTRSPEDADDLVQDTLTRAWRFWDTYERGTNLKAWLFTVLRNTFINGYHRAGRRSVGIDAINSDMRSLGPLVAVANSHSAAPPPDEMVSAEAQRMRVREALDSLPSDYRTAVTLADLEGLSYKEIAEAMECPIGTVMSRIYRGRRILHRLLHDHAVEIGMLDAGDCNHRDVKPAKVSAQCELFAVGM